MSQTLQGNPDLIRDVARCHCTAPGLGQRSWPEPEVHKDWALGYIA